MLPMIRRDRRLARINPSPDLRRKSVTPAFSITTTGPSPTAKPTSAAVSGGASLTRSPATTRLLVIPLVDQQQVEIACGLQQVVGGAAEQSLHRSRMAESTGDQHIGAGLPRGRT